MTMRPIVIGALEITPKGLVKGLEELEIRGRVRDYPDYSIITIGYNTEKTLGDLKRLAVIQIQWETVS